METTKRILLTGATGYIGKRLLPVLLRAGHHVFCCVRDKNRMVIPEDYEDQVSLLEVDFLEAESLSKIPKNIDAAYYLMHSMSATADYESLEIQVAENFVEVMKSTSVEHVIYLSGIVNDEELSKHLQSRKRVEEILGDAAFNFTALRAGIIVGSGSASFEIIRDLVEKLPVMIAPRWLNTKCQPIGIRDVITFLECTLLNKATYNSHFDIAGPDVLTYKEMLMGFAKTRDLKRWIFTVPVMTPRLSSYWLFFVTSTSYNLAVALVNSMKVNVVASSTEINAILDHQPADYKTSLERAFTKIEQNAVISSWKDSLISGRFNENISEYVKVPEYGCFRDYRETEIDDVEGSLERIWSIGGTTGWYYADWLWQIRGFLDKLWGGVGLRRGRTNPDHIEAGDALDFWRVLYADRDKKRLLLFAEMKVPGEAWLEFEIKGKTLHQRATFRPKGILGRLYWYAVFPAHGFVFNGMLMSLAGKREI
ncbi:MAG: SDR family oxidoreductase [Balneolaceae bacterium]|nr:SDR family oxidoreductase [Balneolaceae bacterium]